MAELSDTVFDENGGCGASKISDDIGEDFERSGQSGSIVDEVEEEPLSPSSKYKDDTFEEDESYGEASTLTPALSTPMNHACNDECVDTGRIPLSLPLRWRLHVHQARLHCRRSMKHATSKTIRLCYKGPTRVTG